MRRRWWFVGIPVAYAVAVYLALLVSRSGGDSAEILILVISASVAFGVLAWRFAERLEAARTLAERGRAELALVGKLAAGLSGPLDPTEVATQYLDAISDTLPPTSVATLMQYEEATETIRILAQNGRAATEVAGRLSAIAPRYCVATSVGSSGPESPAASRTAALEAAWPMQTVLMGERWYCMVS